MPNLARIPAAAVLALAASASLPASALTIAATFDASVPAAAQAVINSTIAGYQALFTDNVSIAIDFTNMTSGLGQSSTFVYSVPYATYIADLRADAASAADATAMAHIPLGANPVNGGLNIDLTRANANAVGMNIAAPASGFDSTISLNLGIINVTRTSINPSFYDLQTVVSHEIDEVLGTISGVGQTNIYAADLYRYTSAGVRTFTTAGDNAFFSIDGTTLLAQYNQNAGADFGDWHAGSSPVRVQDAFGTPGTFANLGLELTVLDVVGYNLAPVPEPRALTMMLAGLACIGWVWRRRA